jgi:hypothetical protein
MNEILTVLFIGDIVGKPGRRAVFDLLPGLKEKYDLDFVIANAENAAGGFGLTPKIARALYSYGVDALTSGNHIWRKEEVIPFLNEEKRILRPANYPTGVPGRGSEVFEVPGKGKVGIINLTGQVYLPPIGSPFQVVKQEIEKLRQKTKVILVDFHAEATSEKVALGWFLDGLVSAVIGSHTHIQTADEEILPQKTAYITDVGMTGPFDSVIGTKKEVILEKYLTYLPVKFKLAKDKVKLCGVVIRISPASGQALTIERIQQDWNEKGKKVDSENMDGEGNC